MVIVAHPDDAEFLCGGTVAKLVQSGWTVHYMLTTSGDMGIEGPGDDPREARPDPRAGADGRLQGARREAK